MNKIAPSRLLVYLILAGILPLLLVGSNYFHKFRQLSNLETKLATLNQTLYLRNKKQTVNDLVKEQYSNSDKLYLDQNLESMTFLKDEISNLEQLIDSQTFADIRTAKQRLLFLTSPQNKLSFKEDKQQTFLNIKETLESQINPIEISSADLKNILWTIEAPPSQPGKPQFIVTDFFLDKQQRQSQSNCWRLSLKLIKRDYP
ncbi:MAG: hypothetical protein ACQEP8_03970 [Chlamydiota bacterium]